MCNVIKLFTLAFYNILVDVRICSATCFNINIAIPTEFVCVFRMMRSIKCYFPEQY